MVPGVTTPLAIPVRQLVEFACRSGDLAAGVPGPTASAGLRGHQQLQRSPPPGYRPEVRLSATVALDEFQVELKGRVDLMCAEGEPAAPLGPRSLAARWAIMAARAAPRAASRAVRAARALRSCVVVCTSRLDGCSEVAVAGACVRNTLRHYYSDRAQGEFRFHIGTIEPATSR